MQIASAYRITLSRSSYTFVSRATVAFWLITAPLPLRIKASWEMN